LAGFLISIFGTAFAAIEHPDYGGSLWALTGSGCAGLVAVWWLLFVEKFQNRIDQDALEGNPTTTQKILFTIIGISLLVMAGLLVALIYSLFLQ